MADEINSRPRTQAKPDAGLLVMLKSGNQMGLHQALAKRTPEALAAVEETIALYSGNPEVTFYRLGGMRTFTPESIQTAYDQLVELAGSKALLDDPAYTQSMIAALGSKSGLNEQLMRQLSMDAQALYDYQLLGVQMQLAFQVDSR
ncbi:MAG: hypothetical protein JXA25_10565 [Anaerolineales bacterium]|nr:hypothetical protein [Anaerolineales bacterium]